MLHIGISRPLGCGQHSHFCVLCQTFICNEYVECICWQFCLGDSEYFFVHSVKFSINIVRGLLVNDMESWKQTPGGLTDRVSLK